MCADSIAPSKTSMLPAQLFCLRVVCAIRFGAAFKGAAFVAAFFGWSFGSVLGLSFGFLHDSLVLEAAIGVEP